MNFYLDTNYLVRFVTNDIPAQALKVKRLIEKHKKVKLPVIVVAETAYILEKHYKASKQDVCDILVALTKQPNISTASFVIIGIEIYSNESISFYDALIAAETLVNNGELGSFDEKLVKVLKKYRTE